MGMLTVGEAGRTASQDLFDGQILLQEERAGDLSGHRGQEGQHCRVGERQVL